MNSSRLLTYSMLGVSLKLRVDAPSLFPLAEKLHSSCRNTIEECAPDAKAELVWGRTAEGRNLFQMEAVAPQEAADDATLFFMSGHWLTQIFANRLDNHLQLHASTIVDSSGNGWLISGPSRAGKSSVALSMILSGCGWLSDELALFDEKDPTTILGFPRNFNLKQPSLPHFPETAGMKHSVEFFSEFHGMNVRIFDPQDLRPGSWKSSTRMRGMIFPRWVAGLKEPLIRDVSGLSAVQSILGETFCWQPWAFGPLSLLCRELPAIEFQYSDPRDIAPLAAAMKSAAV